MNNGSTILCLNSGSSSPKFALFPFAGDREKRIVSGAVERIAREGGKIWMRAEEGGVAVERTEAFADHEAAVHAAMTALDEGQLPSPAAVGHRVVHGGPRHQRPA